MLAGKSTKLRRLEEDDAERIFTYWNDYELRQYLASPLPSSKSNIETLIRTKNAAFDNRTEFFFGIESKDSSELIGFASLESVSWISRHGFVGILCLFSSEFRGKGYGKDAMLLLLDYGFSMLDLHCIVLWVEAFNENAITFYENIGFTRGGLMREMAYRNGKRVDVVVMDILKREFVERYGMLAKGNAF